MSKILNRLKKYTSWVYRNDSTGCKKRKLIYDLIICDDIYPHPASGFRMEEFTRLLENFPSSKIILSANAYKFLNIAPEQHANHIAELSKTNPMVRGKLEKMNGAVNINCRLFYCVFLNNIFENLPWLEKNDIPFAFTLYPGGGFNVGTDETKARLKAIFTSPCFRKVIVTQKQTYNYLLDNQFCKKTDILFIFGVVVPQESISNNNASKKYYGEDKQSFDICFCASRYTKYGEDKGYPLFVEFMKVVAAKFDFIQFHVVGGFDKDVINIEEIGHRIKFYGYQDFTRLKTIFNNIDLIISPNEPDKLSKGAFDGFPLGTVIEAAFNGVAVMATDNFGENNYFEEDEELIIIKPDLQEMVTKFETLIGEPGRFHSIAKKGRKKFERIYSNDYQMAPRINLLKSLIPKN